MRVPRLLRMVVLMALLAAVGLAGRVSEPSGGALLRLGGLETANREEVLMHILSGAAPPALVVRDLALPPSPAELELLAAAAGTAPLVAVVPAGVPRLRVEPPTDLRVGSAAAVSFQVRSSPGDSVVVRLVDMAGPVDSARLVVGVDGEARGAFHIRPAREGWQGWRVEAGIVGGVNEHAEETAALDATMARADVGAWARASEPPRVLIVSGPPSPEGRFVARALEESGARVATSIALGRGVRVGEEALGLEEYDVVLLLPGARLSAAQGRELAGFVAKGGGGVLDAGGGEWSGLGVAAGWGGGGEVRGDEVEWELPAELVALPAVAVQGAAESIRELGPGAVAVAWTRGTGEDRDERGGEPIGAGAGNALLALGGVGRGRVGALGLRESWRWRLEGGMVEEHREFWRGLVDWLSGGVRDSLVVRAPLGDVAVGEAAEVRVHRFDGDVGELAAVELRVLRPDGGTERLALAGVPGEPGTLRATLVPRQAGIYALALGGEPPRTAFRVVAEEEAAWGAEPEDRAGEGPAAATYAHEVAAGGRWARLAFLAEKSGGAVVEAPALEGWLEGWRAAHPAGVAWGWWPRGALFGAILLAALTEWIIRRVHGAP